MNYHVHQHHGQPILQHRHDGDVQPHGHAGYTWQAGKPPRTSATDGVPTRNEVTPMEEAELPIRRAYLDDVRAVLPDRPVPAREPHRIAANAHDLGHHELCGSDCEERADG